MRKMLIACALVLSVGSRPEPACASIYTLTSPTGRGPFPTVTATVEWIVQMTRRSAQPYTVTGWQIRLGRPILGL